MWSLCQSPWIDGIVATRTATNCNNSPPAVKEANASISLLVLQLAQKQQVLMDWKQAFGVNYNHVPCPDEAKSRSLVRQVIIFSKATIVTRRSCLSGDKARRFSEKEKSGHKGQSPFHLSFRLASTTEVCVIQRPIKIQQRAIVRSGAGKREMGK